MPERRRCSTEEPACQPRNTHIFLSSLVMTNQREQERKGTWHFPGGDQPPRYTHRSIVFSYKEFCKHTKINSWCSNEECNELHLFFDGAVLNGYLNSQAHPKAFVYYCIEPLTATEIPSHLLRLPCPTMYSKKRIHTSYVNTFFLIWQWINLMATF